MRRGLGSRRARRPDARAVRHRHAPSRSSARRSTSTAARRSPRSSSRTRSTRTRSARRRSASELMREIERYVILQIVDTRWREHLESMDYLREGVHLRAMAQKDPLVEYRGEGHVMFEELGRHDPRGGRAHALPRRDRSSTDGRAAAPARAGAAASSRTSTRRAQGADAIAAAGGGAATASAAPPEPPRWLAAAGRQRAPRHRPQRSVLVRVGQEVQALPRRLRLGEPRVLHGPPPSASVTDNRRLPPGRKAGPHLGRRVHGRGAGARLAHRPACSACGAFTRGGGAGTLSCHDGRRGHTDRRPALGAWGPARLGP